MSLMKALRRQGKAPRAIGIEEVAIPQPASDQVLLRVHFCGVCGSDLHTYLNHPGYESVVERVTLGHELSGTVVSHGAAVSNWSPGQAATMISIQGCLRPTCPYCNSGQTQLCKERKVQGLHLDGGMAEFVAVNEKFLFPVPLNMDMKLAALTEPLSIADHCIVNRSSIKPGDLVVVSGPGIIGLLSALVARKCGAEVVLAGTKSDRRVRLPVAEELGFETVVVGSNLPSLEDQVRKKHRREADVLIEASGAPTAVERAPDVVRTGGRIIALALYPTDVTINMTKIVRKQIDIRSSYGSAIPSYERAVQMLVDGDIPVNKLVNTYPLKKGVSAFEDAEKQLVIKPMLVCNPGDH